MIDQERIIKGMREILLAIGENPDREGLIDTPKRIARMYSEIFSGLTENPKEHLKTKFTCDSNDLVLVKNVAVYSMCEHHLIPFFGQAHIAYIPQNNVVIGLSKLVRVIQCFAKRPQLQERFCAQIADILMEELNPAGVMVVVEAEHMCISMRGVKSTDAKTVTTVSRGIFVNDKDKRKEVFDGIKNN